MTTSHPHLVWVNRECLVRSRDMAEVAELVRAAAEGDQAAWNGLVDRYNGLVWSVARSHRLAMADASDVVQTTWLRLVEHLGRLQDPERVGAWLATTARREALRALRHSARQVPTEELPEAGTTAQLDAALLVAERDQALWQAFGGLSERCQALLRILVADPPPSYEEVGAALDMPIGSIGPTRARCLERLRGLAEGEGVTATDREGQSHD
jgi:RNA polymerase sigma factor (sigma-70 family)